MSAVPPDAGSNGDATAVGKRKGKVKVHHTVGKVVAATMVVIALVTGLRWCSSTGTYNSNLNVVDVSGALKNRPSHQVPAGPSGPINILVMGSDNRDAPGDHIDNLTGIGKRSDTTILLHLSADRKHAYGVSIPRDSIVDRAACYDNSGKEISAATTGAMWNDAFNIGGPACTIEQFEQLTQCRSTTTSWSTSPASSRWSTPSAGSTSALPHAVNDTDRPHHAAGRHPQVHRRPRPSTTCASGTTSATAPTSAG